MKAKDIPIVIVDDEKISRRLVESAVERTGYPFQSFADEDEAWEYCKTLQGPFVLLLDWVMPKKSGLGFTRELRSLDREIEPYIIMITQKDMKRDLLRGFEAGVDDFLTKPFNAEELQMRIQVGMRLLGTHLNLMEQIQRLEEAKDRIKTLEGILPICMYCHKIRDESDTWNVLEIYVEQHSTAKFSHSLCPSCLDKFYRGELEGTEE